MNARHWVEKAVLSKGNKHANRAAAMKNKGLLDVFQGDGILAGSDNHRIHFWTDVSIEAEPEGEIKYPLKRLTDYLEKGRVGIELCELSTYSLKKACSVALAFFKKQYSGDYVPEKFIYVHIDEERIEIGSDREEVGSMRFTLVDGDTFPLRTKTHDLSYEFKAEHPDHFFINPKYFKQALEGMGKIATLRRNGHVLYMKGDSGAEAVVMPLDFDSFAKLYAPYDLNGDREKEVVCKSPDIE